jgi:TPR repeat protein
MATSLKIFANDGQPGRTRMVVVWIALFVAAGAVIGLFLPAQSPPPEATESAAEPSSAPLSLETAGETCLRLLENPSDYLSQDALNRRYELRNASCNMAFAAHPDNVHYKVAVARTLPHAQRSEQLSMLREAAAQDDAEAYYEIYESHKSWDQGDLDKPQLVTRAEADHALRRAAELDHPFSMQMLAVLLDRGSIVRRDREAAIYWAERAVAHPAKDETRANLQVLLGRLLVKSASPDERARGIELLEKLSKAGPFDAKTELAIAIRKDDPVRARALLEESLRPNPGGAPGPLAEMLISGEGGAANPRRALSLLKAHSDTAGAKAVLGQLHVEGRLVRRDVQEGVRLIDFASGWDLDLRLLVLRLLAANPEVRVNDPKDVLYSAAMAAELDEPGALALLVDLKLSGNAQFQDRPGACKLIETAAGRGDQTMTPRLGECRAK